MTRYSSPIRHYTSCNHCTMTFESDLYFFHLNYLQGSLAILRLLLSQAKQVREIPPEERANAVYLQDISLEKNKSHIRDNDMVDIQAVS